MPRRLVNNSDSNMGKYTVEVELVAAGGFLCRVWSLNEGRMECWDEMIKNTDKIAEESEKHFHRYIGGKIKGQSIFAAQFPLLSVMLLKIN